MLVTDSRFISGQYLPAEEANLRYRERKIEPLLDTYRLSDHADLSDLEKRAGERLHSSEFIYRVQQLNPNVFVEQQINYPNEWGFYAESAGKKIYLASFAKGWVREFTAQLLDGRNLADEKIPGWREALLRLLAKGMLTWEQVQETFGDSQGLNSDRWQQYTEVFRSNAGSAQVGRNLSNEL